MVQQVLMHDLLLMANEMAVLRVRLPSVEVEQN